MNDEFVAEEARRDRRSTQANASGILDAAALDERRGEVEATLDLFGFLRPRPGNPGEDAAQVGDFFREAVEPLVGGQIEVKAAARVELGRDLVEAGLASAVEGRGGCGHRGGRRRGRPLFRGGGFALPASRELGPAKEENRKD